jgi:hypothetical protein
MSPDRDIFANSGEPKSSELSERAEGLWTETSLTTTGSTVDVFYNEALRRSSAGPKPWSADFLETAKTQVLDVLSGTEAN